MDVFPLLSPHFSSFLMCVLFDSFSTTHPTHSYFVLMSVTWRRVQHSQHISHGLWVAECSIQKFQKPLEALSVSKQRHNAFWVWEMYIAHKSWTDSQAKSKQWTIHEIYGHKFGDLGIYLKFEATSMVLSQCRLAFLSFWWMISSIENSKNTYFTLCCSSKYSSSEMNCNSRHISN